MNIVFGWCKMTDTGKPTVTGVFVSDESISGTIQFIEIQQMVANYRACISVQNDDHEYVAIVRVNKNMLIFSIGMTIRVVDLPCRTIQPLEVLGRNPLNVGPEVKQRLRVLRESLHRFGKVPWPFLVRNAMHDLRIARIVVYIRPFPTARPVAVGWWAIMDIMPISEFCPDWRSHCSEPTTGPDLATRYEYRIRESSKTSRATQLIA